MNSRDKRGLGWNAVWDGIDRLVEPGYIGQYVKKVD